ncbi:MAG: hypothetical protein PHE50_02885 [Dehalococcoidales bacterium]|nr:hypothetical protein [Dehalococcoidales bacterium]
MTLPNNIITNKSTGTDNLNDGHRPKSPDYASQFSADIQQLEALPRRNPLLHWFGFALSLVSFVVLAVWTFGSQGAVDNRWLIVDIGLGVAFTVEFLTRSGFRWNRGAYLRSHFFDFFAIVPALALVNHGFPIEMVLVWLILVARFIRVIDRFLGDGFVRRNILALLEGFEEEITDRVLQRIVDRLQGDMDRVGLTHGVAKSLSDNKEAILRRVRDATPHEGLVPGLAHMVGLDAALERAEEKTFDSMVGIINSEAVDRAVRDIVYSSFTSIRNELGRKTWRQHLGIQRHGSIKKSGPPTKKQEV